MPSPIWKDYIISLGSAASTHFRIMQGGAVLYQGRSVMRPGQTSNLIRINDICADYMPVDDLSFVDGGVTPLTPAPFIIQTSSDGSTGWTDFLTVEFTPDWSYDYSVEGPLSCPIKPAIDPRQLLLVTVSDVDTQAIVIIRADGSEEIIKVRADYNNDFNLDFATQGLPISADTSSIIYVINLAEHPDIVSVSVGDTVYRVDANACSRYVLYYKNAFGGWDSLLIEGNDKRTDQLTRNDIQLDYDNRTESARGRRNYLNEIIWGVQLSTGWMDDVQAGRMHHLLESTDVYLHDLSGVNGLRPVTLTDTVVEYRTYQNNGRRLVNYTFNARVAQDFIRR